MSLNRRFFPLALVVLALLPGCDSSSNTPEAQIVVEDIKIGDGDEVGPGQTIIVDYVGSLEDGTVFDSSDIQQEPLIFTLGVNNVIAGLDEGIPGMKVGGERRIEIPPEKAFGKTGMCRSDGSCPVPPNATVTFDITVVDILDYVIQEELTVGTGTEAQSGDLVQIDFVGLLQDNSIFANSQETGPLTFVLGAGYVIQGLDDGIAGMKVGGSRKLVIPPSLAYGAYGSLSGAVPPYATLIYRIDLLDVTTADSGS